MNVTALQNLRANLRQISLAEGLSQREVAKRCDLAFTYVNRILVGKADPSITVCEKIANGLGVPLDILLGDPRNIFHKST